MSTVRRMDSPPRPRAVSSEILDRQPPSSLEAELGVLASILIMPDVCDDVALILRSSDFYDDANRKIYEHMIVMHEEGRRIDPTLLVDRLKKSGDFEMIGGMAYLAQVSQAAPHAAHAVYYANIVREKSTFRSLINASTEILRDAYDESGEAKELLSQSEQKIFGILDSRGSSSVSSIQDVLHEAMDRIDAVMRGEHTMGGTDTGFSDIDALTGGLHKSELIILAARPSMGKTALAMNIAENVAIKFDVPVLFVSLEMSSIELAERLLCSVSRVNGHRLRNGTLSNEDRRRLVEKAAEVSQSPLFVDDSPSRTVSEIAAAARRIRRRQKRLGLVVVDYLQLIEPDNSMDPRQEQVAKIARRLKGMARELDVPVLCLAQVSRQAEDSKFHRPRLSHLRESGAIEQDADVVMFVHREEYFRQGEEQEQFAGQAELIVAKQRNGPTGTIELVWKKEYTRFEDKAPERFDELDEFNTGDAERILIRLPTMYPNEPNEVLVFDGTDECPYLPGRTARMPLRLPMIPLTRNQVDHRLAKGDRRTGSFLYRTECPNCRACEPLRVIVREFAPSRTQRRIYRRGERSLTWEIGEPRVDRRRVDLFNAHREQRGLVGRDGQIDQEAYASFLIDTCCDTSEICYLLDDQIVAVALLDRGDDSLSAVYCYFDPRHSRLSLGVYSILKQIDLCRDWGVQYLYLGLYVADCGSLSYKAEYLPHERLIDDVWLRYSSTK